MGDAGAGFVRLNRSTQLTADLLEYLLRRPNAWTLFSLIALRARRLDGIDPKSGVKLVAGEALLGDYLTIGMTEQKYRTAKKQLSLTGQVTFRVTNRGTIAKLVKTDVYNINMVNGNDQGNTKRTNEQQSDNEQSTTNKNVNKFKNENNEKVRDLVELEKGRIELKKLQLMVK